MAGLFVFAAAFAVYAWTAWPAMGWLDSPEFVAASVSLGVPHSPGHPLPVLAGWLGTLVPIGDLPFRVNLMSALAAALASVALYRAAWRYAGVVAPDVGDGARRAAAVAVALLVALSGAAWLQAVRAEVYALESLLWAAAACGLIAVAAGEIRWLVFAALAAGLALATHHLIALAGLVSGLWCLRGLAGRSRRIIALAALAVILGLAVFLQLPVRSARHPEVNWGAPHTAERFAWTVSARAFHKAAGAEHVSDPGEDAAQVVFSLAEQVGWPALLLALLGGYLGLRRRATRPATGFLLGAVILTCAVRVLVGFDPDTPDHQGYLLPAVMAAALLAMAGGLAATTARPALAPLVAAVLAAWIPVHLAAGARIGAGYASAELAGWETDALPPRTLLLTAYFQTDFRLVADRLVSGARPDVALIDRSFLSYPGAVAEAERAHPDLAGLLRARLEPGAPAPVAALADVARRRPVFVELHINLDPALDRWLLPVGAFARLVPEPPDVATRAGAEAFDRAARQRLPALLGPLAPGDAGGVRDALLWHDYNRLEYYCRTGRRDAAQATLDPAWQLAPGDITLRALATRCSLSVP